jgi:lipopolysaccharide transport system ATP-binding protein
MSDIIISVENLGKCYQIDHEQPQGYTALRDVIANKAKNIFKSSSSKKEFQKTEDFWAVKNVSFEVKQGDAVGIIGRNGAGKSTLLKLLSRITEPTKGRIALNGRVASLLEVGTGFHPELSGRENIYLNGAILGMSRREIKAKFDEIVDFSGVEKFLDTPVKRYSSGMYVRLAFSVAAHLEPEILIVDEVLAVGDAEFQKKCLGKMDDVSKKEGRTVLFVSHNMGSIADLCNVGVLLNSGTVQMVAGINEVVNEYITSKGDNSFYHLNKSTTETYIETVRLTDNQNSNRKLYSQDEDVYIEITLKNSTNIPANTNISVIINDKYERALFASHNLLVKGKKGTLILLSKIPGNLLLCGTYPVKVLLHIPYVRFVQNDIPFINLEIEDNTKTEHSLYKEADIGYIDAKTEWHVKESY